MKPPYEVLNSTDLALNMSQFMALCHVGITWQFGTKFPSFGLEHVGIPERNHGILEHDN
jgi:hypothetical protein